MNNFNISNNSTVEYTKEKLSEGRIMEERSVVEQEWRVLINALSLKHVKVVKVIKDM